MATFHFQLVTFVLLQIHRVVVVLGARFGVLGLHVPHFSLELQSDTLLILALFFNVELLFLDLLVVVAVLSAEVLVLLPHDLDLSLEYKLFPDNFQVLFA
jgi:hypothetical protein